MGLIEEFVSFSPGKVFFHAGIAVIVNEAHIWWDTGDAIDEKQVQQVAKSIEPL